MGRFNNTLFNQMSCISDIDAQFSELLKVVYMETMLAQNEMLSALSAEELSKLSMLF